MWSSGLRLAEWLLDRLVSEPEGMWAWARHPLSSASSSVIEGNSISLFYIIESLCTQGKASVLHTESVLHCEDVNTSLKPQW